MGLKVMCAGCSKEERDIAENAVRQALGKRAQSGAWTISLVKITGRWSVTVDEPSSGIRALTLVAPQGRLRETIAGALERPGDAVPERAAAAGSAPTPPPVRERTPPPAGQRTAPPARERTPPPARARGGGGRRPPPGGEGRPGFFRFHETGRGGGEADAPLGRPPR